MYNAALILCNIVFEFGGAAEAAVIDQLGDIVMVPK